MPPIYPPQPQQGPKKKNNGCLIAVVVILSLGVLGAIVNAGKSGSTTTETTTTSSSSTNNSADIDNSQPKPTHPPAIEHFKVGDTVKVADTWEITVNSVKVDTGGKYSLLSAGNVYLLVDVGLKNITDKQKSLYGSSDWTLKGADGQKYNSSIFSGSPEPPDGKVEPGDPAKGVLAYEVLGTAKDFRLAFEVSWWTGKQVIWDITV
jgi:hypothetical protein